MSEQNILQFVKKTGRKMGGLGNKNKELFPSFMTPGDVKPLTEIGDDPVLNKLHVIDENIKASREMISQYFNRLTQSQQSAIHAHIVKDLEQTKSHLYSMSHVLLSYLLSLKEKMVQNPLVHNYAYFQAEKLCNIAQKANLFLPKSLALLEHSLQRFPKYAKEFFKALKELNQFLIKYKKGDCPLLVRNKNYEWLKIRGSSLKARLVEKRYKVSKSIDQKHYKAVMHQIIEVEGLIREEDFAQYSLLRTLHQNGLRFYQALFIQNSLNEVRYFCKNFNGALKAF